MPINQVDVYCNGKITRIDAVVAATIPQRFAAQLGRAEFVACVTLVGAGVGTVQVLDCADVVHARRARVNGRPARVHPVRLGIGHDRVIDPVQARRNVGATAAAATGVVIARVLESDRMARLVNQVLEIDRASGEASLVLVEHDLSVDPDVTCPRFRRWIERIAPCRIVDRVAVSEADIPN